VTAARGEEGGPGPRRGRGGRHGMQVARAARFLGVGGCARGWERRPRVASSGVEGGGGGGAVVVTASPCFLRMVGWIPFLRF
jgi:hypothetical protein